MLTDPGRDLVGKLARLRTAQIRDLVTSAVPRPRPPGTVELLNALVTAVGETSEERWWQSWAQSASQPR